MASAVRNLPQVSTRQLFKYVNRFVQRNPVNTRAVPPSTTFRAPNEPGVGLFFLPAGTWKKNRAVAVGPLGETDDYLHPCKIQIARSLIPEATSAPPSVHVWGIGGGPRVARNLASGVAEGFAVTLELHGVGYRAEIDEKNQKLQLRLGLSHIIELPLEENGVFFNVLSPQVLQVAGINRADVHRMAAKVRDFRKPEPYKGKGIRYRNEPVRRKEAKKD